MFTRTSISFASTVRTAALLALLTGLLVVVGRWLGGPTGMAVALVLALLMNFGAYWFSDRLVLAMAGAREVTFAEAPQLHRLVATLARRAGLPAPRVYLALT